jgi:hypothetical protein
MITKKKLHRGQSRSAPGNPPKVDPRETEPKTKLEAEAALEGAEIAAEEKNLDAQDSKMEADKALLKNAPTPPTGEERTRTQSPPDTLDAVDAAARGADTTREEAPWTPTAAASPVGGTPPGPPAAEGAREALAKAGMIEEQLRADWNRSDQEMGELHQILETIIGHLENHSRRLEARQGELSDLRAQLTNLEGSVNYNRNGR